MSPLIDGAIAALMEGGWLVGPERSVADVLTEELRRCPHPFDDQRALGHVLWCSRCGAVTVAIGNATSWKHPSFR